MERMLKIVLNFFNNKKLMLEEDLQTTINSDKNIEIKLNEIDRILGEMVLIDEKINKWNSLVNANPSDISQEE